MIPRRNGDDAARSRGVVEEREPIERAAHLERAGLLQRLALVIQHRANPCTESSGREHGRVMDAIADALAGGANVGKREHGEKRDRG